jgi:hypothetical protein
VSTTAQNGRRADARFSICGRSAENVVIRLHHAHSVAGSGNTSAIRRARTIRSEQPSNLREEFLARDGVYWIQQSVVARASEMVRALVPKTMVAGVVE